MNTPKPSPSLNFWIIINEIERLIFTPSFRDGKLLILRRGGFVKLLNFPIAIRDILRHAVVSEDHKLLKKLLDLYLLTDEVLLNYGVSSYSNSPLMGLVFYVMERKSWVLLLPFSGRLTGVLDFMNNKGNTILHILFDVKEESNFFSDEFFPEKKYISRYVDVKNKNGDFPLLLAIKENNFKAFEWLIELGADINIVGKRGNTPLLLASIFRNIEMIDRLLDLGADINMPNERGCKFEHHIIVLPEEYRKHFYKRVKEIKYSKMRIKGVKREEN